MYKVVFSKSAQKDAEKIRRSKLGAKCRDLIALLSVDPFSTIPPYEKLVGDLKGFYSKRINILRRLVYEVDEKQKIVKVLRMWSHYD